MEIAEVVYYFVDDLTNTLEVQFRLINDSEDEIRIDKIDLNDVINFGIELDLPNNSFYDYDEDDIEYDNQYSEIEINESDLLSFLNEYYVINPNNLPNII
jgi:hypothetical protein